MRADEEHATRCPAGSATVLRDPIAMGQYYGVCTI
jgi:hypothetical protein